MPLKSAKRGEKSPNHHFSPPKTRQLDPSGYLSDSLWKGYSANFAGTRNGATPHKKRAGRLVPALDVSF